MLCYRLFKCKNTKFIQKGAQIMLKKVDTIDNKNIDENQLMVEKIVDIINGYGVENCGLRISNGVILVSTIY